MAGKAIQVISKEELTVQWDTTSFVESTIDQINKDLGVFNIEAISLTNPSLVELQAALSKRMMDFLKHQARELPQLMYTIDIPERLFNELTTSMTFFDDLSLLIIQREAMKVYLRQTFTSK